MIPNDYSQLQKQVRDVSSFEKNNILATSLLLHGYSYISHQWCKDSKLVYQTCIQLLTSVNQILKTQVCTLEYFGFPFGVALISTLHQDNAYLP